MRSWNSLLSYFPLRLMMVAFLLTMLYMNSIDAIESTEERLLLALFKFASMPSFYLDGNLYVGIPPSQFTPILYTQGMYIIFVTSMLLAAKTSNRIRAKMLAYDIMLFAIFIFIQFISIFVVYTLGMGDSVGYVRLSLVLSTLSAGAVIELMLFTILTLPRPNKINPVIKRNYLKEIMYLVLSMSGSIVLLYLLMDMLEISRDSLISTFFVLQIPTIFAFRYYVAYFMTEIEKPIWLKRHKSEDYNPPVSFLIPAFNEENTIKQLLESVDKAASNYKGPVESVVINDGSTDSTASKAKEAFDNLKHSSFQYFEIPNSGKGHALKYGLEKCSGEIIFRLDGDSRIHESAIRPAVIHFTDPTVASVSGMLLPLKNDSFWQKAMVMVGCFQVFFRRSDSMMDALLVQPGSYSVFRKDALQKVGGWPDKQLGEDGEITGRLGRYGYRNEFEERSIAYSEVPQTWKMLRRQRVRWSIAFFHSRSKNLRVLRDFAGPRSFMYMNQIITHGSAMPTCIFGPFVIAALISGVEGFSFSSLLHIIDISTKILTFHLFLLGIQVVLYIHFLRKINRLRFLRYIPHMTIWRLLLGTLIRPEAISVMLSHSSKHRKYDDEAFQTLRKELLESTK